MTHEEKLQHVIEEFMTHSSRYFDYDTIASVKEISLYQGLYWNTYKSRVNFAHGAHKTLYIKIIEQCPDPKKHSEYQQLAAESYHNLQRLYQGFQEFPGYSVIEPVACFPDRFCLISAESLGTDLWTILREKARFYPSDADLHLLEKYCAGCGKWLAFFQKITREPERDPFDFEPAIELFNGYLSKLTHHQAAFPDELRMQILAFCSQLANAASAKDRQVAGIHGDLAPVNMLVHHNDIIALDIEVPRYGPIYWDSTYFYYHLETLLEHPMYRPTTIKRLQDAFVTGFGMPLEPANPMVIFCMIHNVIQALLYLTAHRQQVNWYRKVYDQCVYQKHVRWLQQTCQMEFP